MSAEVISYSPIISTSTDASRIQAIEMSITVSAFYLMLAFAMLLLEE